MRDAVIVEAVRTPIGKRNGALSAVHPTDLAAAVLTGLSTRSQLDPALVDDVVLGCVSQVGEQSLDIARMAVLAAGWPDTVPGTTVDRACGSSQQAVHFAAAGVIAGHYDFVVAGGIEVMSRVPLGTTYIESPYGDPFAAQGFSTRYDGEQPHQGVAAERLVRQHGFSRTQLDELSLLSHERAATAQDDGEFDGQIVPVTLPDGTVVDTDEGIRRGGTLESLAALRPAFASGGTITAGNSCQISDGAAALLITTSELARRHGLRPLARVHTCVLAAADPITLLTAPVPATHKALARANLSMDEIGTFEVNEAFACVPMFWQQETGADPKAVNPQGGSIALGHPLGASGARLMTTLVHRMRDQSIRFGLQTMCEGGGQANATILELV